MARWEGTLDGRVQGDGRGRIPGWARSLVQRAVFWVAVLNLVTIVGTGALSRGHTFWMPSNLQSLALSASEMVVLAVGSALLLGAGQFDISLGPNLILSSVVAAEVLLALSGGQSGIAGGGHQALPLAIAVSVLAGIAASTAVGAINGLVVVRFRVNALIATLGTLGIADGIALIVTNGADVANLPRSLQSDFGVARLGGVPEESIVALAVAVGLWFLLEKTGYGVRTLAIGSSGEAGRRAGINVGLHTWALFTLVGGLAGVSGVLDLMQFGTTNVAGHQTDALVAISAAVIGGATLSGGRASIGGATLGAIWIVVVESALVALSVSAYYQFVAVGAALIAAVAVDELRRQRP